MYTLKISSEQPFGALIGFDFSLGPLKNIGYDVFGYIETNQQNRILVSVYLGNGPVELMFLCSSLIDRVSIDIYSGSELPHYIFLPHWWQKIGIFG